MRTLDMKPNFESFTQNKWYQKGNFTSKFGCTVFPKYFRAPLRSSPANYKGHGLYSGPVDQEND